MDKKVQLLYQSLALVYSQNTTALVSSWLCAIFAFVMFWQTANPWVFPTWVVLYTAISIVRVRDHRHFKKYRTNANVTYWSRRLFTVLVISASCSGTLLAYLAWIADDLQLALLIVIVAGLLTGALVSYSNSTRAFLSSSMPFAIPPTIVLFFKQNASITLIAFLMIIWMILVFRCSVRIQQAHHQSIATALANADLVKTLQTKNAQVEKLNRTLHQSVAVLESAQSELKVASTTDFLTKIPNRRRFMHALDREWQRACENQTELAVVICDVDFFKLYNDQHGHLEGDQVLFQVGQIIASAALRPNDCSARYGGEEFTILLAEASSDNAYTIAERARRNLERLKIPNRGSSISNYLTMSIGIASAIPAAGDSSRWLLEQADNALYLAKQKGRNTTVVATPDLQKTGTWPDRIF